MSETIREQKRRLKEGFFDIYTKGKGVDIGCGRDPVTPDCDQWDQELGCGDATFMTGVPDSTYDWVHSSHCLEHISNREVCLQNWWRILKPGGYLIIIVPHRNLYEQRTTLPSQGNADHKTFILPWRDEAPHTVGLIPLLNRVLQGEILSYRFCPPYGMEVIMQKRVFDLPPAGTPWVQL